MVSQEKLRKKGVLILEDGAEFPGLLFGAPLSATSTRHSPSTQDFGYGEVVFNTSLSGYQEILTDPSYAGQMVCMTNPHIGNTGVNGEDPESSKIWCSGFIIQQLSETESGSTSHANAHWRSTGSLEDYLLSNEIPGLCEVDTRALTRHLRSRGVVRGVILPFAEKNEATRLLATLPPFEGRDLISKVTTQKTYSRPFPGGKKPEFKVVVMDFGVKTHMLRLLEEWGCELTVVPAHTSSKAIVDLKPDGVFLSNGPGDPTAAPYALKTIQELLGKQPIFGVCMGHQLLALALGAKTYKLKFGHRGGNQPVIDLSTQKVEISSHNHGYSVLADPIPPGIEITHLNLNDKTVEGLSSQVFDAFSVQYHPEACPGPHDSTILFEKFIQTLRNKCIKNT